ncbi:MAG: tetratricopeptide repeat protein [Flavobacteriales bacterium]|nr:tetratricopeptide repeat protein [Flavobacteriales bacterium]
MIGKTCLLLSIVILSLFIEAKAQEFADKEYYLIDSLVFEDLTQADRSLVDSCLKLYHTEEAHDTIKIDALSGICEFMVHDAWTNYQFYLHSMIEHAMEDNATSSVTHKLKKLLGLSHNNIGYIYNGFGEKQKAMQHFREALAIYEELKDKDDVAITLNNIGTIYNAQGNVIEALEYFHKALKVQEELQDKWGMATCMHNIGYMYKSQDDLEKGLEYYYKSLKIREEIQDKLGIAETCNNIALIYNRFGDPSCELSNEECVVLSKSKAFDLYIKTLKLEEELGNKRGIAGTLNNIGSMYEYQGKLEKALEHFERALGIQKEIKYKKGMAICNDNIAALLLKMGNLKGAKEFAARGMELATELAYPRSIMESAETMKSIALVERNYQQALEMYELQIIMRDSINNEKTQKATIRQQTKYEFEKAQLVAEQQRTEALRIKNAELKRRDNLQYTIIFLVILLVFGLVLSLGFIRLPPTIAEGLIFFAFLILFEFILVLVDPYVDDWTGGEPMYKLLLNAVLAGLIFPLHALFERSLKKRLAK